VSRGVHDADADLKRGVLDVLMFRAGEPLSRVGDWANGDSVYILERSLLRRVHEPEPVTSGRSVKMEFGCSPSRRASVRDEVCFIKALRR
jgi:hypothetical protein